jgi:hypothetical protein
LVATLALPPQVVAAAVNRLSSKGILKFFKGKDGAPLFKRVSVWPAFASCPDSHRAFAAPSSYVCPVAACYTPPL